MVYTLPSGIVDDCRQDKSITIDETMEEFAKIVLEMRETICERLESMDTEGVKGKAQDEFGEHCSLAGTCSSK